MDADQLFLARHVQRETAEEYKFKINGVSFDGRQAAVMNCKAGTPVMLIPEPTNPFDSGAIKVCLLTGKQLGFVPRRENHLPIFNRPTQFGHINYMGAHPDTNPSLYGANVIIQSSVEPFTAQAVPSGLEEGMNRLLRQAIPNYDHEDVVSQAMTAMTSSAVAQAIEWTIVPTWETDELNRVFRLTGFQMTPKRLRDAHTDFRSSMKPESDSVDVYCRMNMWTEDDAMNYFYYIRELQQTRENEGWTIDYSYLATVGIQSLQI